MKKIKYIIYLIILISIGSCNRNKVIQTQKDKYCYEWSDMPFHNKTENSIKKELGKPEKVRYLEIKQIDINKLTPLVRPLVRFIPKNKDIIHVKEYNWKQDSFLIYYWFVKKDSLWCSIDAIMYDPNHVEF